MMGLGTDGEAVAPARAGTEQNQESGLSGHEAWHTSTFWLMVGAFFLMAVSFTGCLVHLVPMLTDRGLSAQNAALATSLLSGGVLLGRVGAGYLLDRFFAPSVAVCFFCGATLGVVLLWGGVTGSLVFVAAALVGLGVGAEFDIMPYA